MNLRSAFAILILLTSPAALAKKETVPNRAPSAAIAGPSDAEILHVFVTTNSVAIDAATVTQSRTKNKELLALTKLIIDDHTSLNTEATALAKKKNIRPTSNLTSQGLTNQARLDVNKLKSLEGKPLDDTYLAIAVTGLEKAAGQLEDNLLPNSKDAEVKSILVKSRSVYGTLAGKIKKLQADLTK